MFCCGYIVQTRHYDYLRKQPITKPECFIIIFWIGVSLCNDIAVSTKFQTLLYHQTLNCVNKAIYYILHRNLKAILSYASKINIPDTLAIFKVVASLKKRRFLSKNEQLPTKKDLLARKEYVNWWIKKQCQCYGDTGQTDSNSKILWAVFWESIEKLDSVFNLPLVQVLVHFNEIIYPLFSL